MKYNLFNLSGLLALAAFAASINGAIAGETSDFVAPGGVWWHAKSRIRVTKEITLEQPTVWEAEEIFINARVITNGHPLIIQTRKLALGEGASITGFVAPAEATPPGKAHANSAPAGVGTVQGGKGSPGKRGKDGFAGLRGNHGMGVEGNLPGEVGIFAAHVEGFASLIGIGQQGGIGGKGGPGQNGGTGGQGDRAYAYLIGSNTRAGSGGTGGAFGLGGRGGDGGTGGAPVPIRLLMATNPETGEPRPTLTCQPGKGGEPGPAGEPGEPGAGGPGGPGDYVEALFITATEPAGPPGDSGKACPYKEDDPRRVLKCTKGNGNLGPDGTMPSAEVWLKAIGRDTPNFIKGYSDFEKARFKVVFAWYQFHWWRLFERLSRNSLELMRSHAGVDPLDDLLKGNTKKAALKILADRWRKGFFETLEAEEEKTRGRDHIRELMLKNIRMAAAPFVQALT